MTEAHSTGRAKPRKDLPLTAHSRGYWCKKVLGKIRYFGKIADDPTGKAALNKWLDTKDILLAGEDPADYQAGDVTVADICNHFPDANFSWGWGFDRLAQRVLPNIF